MLDSLLVTGGSRGIGEAIVRYFRAVGYRVAFTYNISSAQAQLIESETGATAICASNASSDDAVRAVALARTAIGDIEVLINCAGISQIKPFLDITEADWESMMRVNAFGAYAFSKAVLPSMLRKQRGRIINIASVWGEYGASCEVHYSASKAAIIGFTKALAMELAPSGITVNCISPGVIDTDMNSHLSAAEMTELVKQIPAGRVGKPVEVARLAHFLASDGAEYITGQDIAISGGFR